MDTTLQDPLVGRELDGRYLVRSRIARGGMATVYLALDRRLDRDVAVKIMHAHLADDPQFTARFIREARSAARLSHPNVVQVYDQGADGDLLYLAMEYLRGRTLREVLAERRVLTPRETLTVLEPLLDALAAAHRIGLVHRDIKPENVVLTDDGRVKVADFGLARAATAHTSTTGVLLGTVGYLAPELVVRGLADARSDVYAVGIMLFEMLTGRPPFTGGVPIQVAYKHVNEQVPPPSALVPEIDVRLDSLVEAATAREPDDRPADAGELLVRVRAVHAQLTSAQLDSRPHVPVGPSAEAEDAGADLPTEAFSPFTAPQRTRALTELDAVGLTLRKPRAPDTGDATRDAHGARSAIEAPRDAEPEPPPAEDAALAALLRRRRVIGFSALLTVLVLALGLAAAAWYYAIGPGAYTSTPTVIGLQVAAAQDALRAARLRSNEKKVFHDTVAEGIVVSTDPGSGSPVRKDGAVELRVSQGPEFVIVPKVVGRKEDDARRALDAAHLSAGEARQQYSDESKGEVVTVEPSAGSQIRNGTAVTLTVSKGPQPVDVPDVVGKSRAEADAALRAVRLVPAYGTAVFNDDAPAGEVVSQSPHHGTLLPRQKVTLVLSKGPELVAVPNVVGKQIGEARSMLRAAGFEVRRAELAGGFFGTVRFQLPGANSRAPKGSTVLLTVV